MSLRVAKFANMLKQVFDGKGYLIGPYSNGPNVDARGLIFHFNYKGR